MSAITGIYHLNQEPVPYDHIKTMLNSLHQFPVDDVQVLQRENIFLGCHAQWITPESIGEKLPYYHYELQLSITADAIIDNRSELFNKLQVEHSKRKMISDSELILLSYNKWKEECPKHLIGDFSFIIWDERERKLFGARDFSGSRTLYYYSDSTRFAFCTLMKPLLQLPYIKNELSEQWTAEFLAIPWNYETVDVGSTVYEKLKQIPPSHSITVSRGTVKLTRYSTLISKGVLKLGSNEEYEEAFKEVFQEAISSRLRSNYQIGAHLSGGLDSGSVACLAANSLKEEKKKLHTFSYVPVKDFVDWTPKSRVANERPLIQSTVQFNGNIKDHYFDFEEKSPLSEIDVWLDSLEMPYKFFENTYWLKGMFEKAQEQDIRVLLNGQRGNWTVSWGPVIDYQAMLLKKIKWLSLYREMSKYSENLGVTKSRVFSVVTKKALSNSRKSNNTELFPSMINSDFAMKTGVYEKLKQHKVDLTGSMTDSYAIKKHQFEQLFHWNITGTYSSKLSIQHSVWDRDPTNDLRVIKYCLSVPEEQYVQNGYGRSLIRRSTKEVLPDDIRLNQRTRGVQGADGIHRMIPIWESFIQELEKMSNDSLVADLLNIHEIKKSILKYKYQPKPEHVYDLDFRILMRSLIFYRFMKRVS
ncbi:asparagine synthase-related protein [Rossellomorea aquimaris]|uniref:asparagine synthase-related protein n=1 Tax=Rossellomorea aquimaris TaxID=189382 RepID=UPI0007D04DAE|nr:asparagine synthase-related protein [Rossellomorea aquimaris]